MPQQSPYNISGRHLGWFILILVCVGVGIGALYIPVTPLLIGAVVLMLLFMMLVLRYPYLGLILYLFVFMYRPGEVFTALAPLRVELLTGSLAMLAVILHQILNRQKVTLPVDKISISLLMFLGVIFLSTITSYEKTITVETGIDFIKLLIFYYLIVSLIDTRRRFMIFMCFFTFMIFYLGADAFKEYLAGNYHTRMGVDRLVGSTSAGGDPNTLAATLATSIPLFIAVAMYFRDILRRLAWIGGAFSMIPLVAITGSRSGVIALVTVIMVGISYARHRVALFALVIVIGIAGWSVLPQQYRERYERFGEVTENLNEASSGRWAIWQTGVQMVIERPFLGIGAGAFLWAHVSGDFGASRWLESHSLYIQLAAEMGVIGLAAWLIFIYLLISKLRYLSRRVRSEPELRWMRLFANAITAVIITLLISGFFGHNLYRYTWYVLAGLTVSLYNMLPEVKPGEAAVEEPRQTPAGVTT